MKNYASKPNLLAYRILNRSLKVRKKAAKKLKNREKKRGKAKRALLKGNDRKSQAKGVKKRAEKQRKGRKQWEKGVGLLVSDLKLKVEITSQKYS